MEWINIGESLLPSKALSSFLVCQFIRVLEFQSRHVQCSGLLFDHACIDLEILYYEGRLLQLTVYKALTILVMVINGQS